MSGKHFGWHKAWSRLPSGRLRHISGIEFEHDEELGMCTCSDTLAEFQRFELNRGVRLEDFAARVQRLAHEAAMWNANPKNALK